jgi:chromosome segregation ATPase
LTAALESLKRKSAQELESTIETMKKKNQELRTAVETARKERSQLQVSLEESTKRNQVLESDFKKCAAKAAEISRSLRKMRLAINPNAVVGDKDEEEPDLTNRLVSKLTALRELFSSSSQDIESLVHDRTKLQKQVSELERRLDDLRNENDRLRAEVEALLEQSESLQEANDIGAAERGTLSETIAHLRLSLRRMTAALTESDQKRAVLKKQLVARNLQLAVMNGTVPDDS